MTALTQYWRDFSAWVKGRQTPLTVLSPIPVESWAERKRAYERAYRMSDDETRALRALTKSHPWLVVDVEAAVRRAEARQ